MIFAALYLFMQQMIATANAFFVQMRYHMSVVACAVFAIPDGIAVKVAGEYGVLFG